MRYLAVATTEKNSRGEAYHHYVDTTAIIAISPLFSQRDHTQYENGARLHLVTGAIIETSYLPLYVIQLMKYEEGRSE